MYSFLALPRKDDRCCCGERDKIDGGNELRNPSNRRNRIEVANTFGGEEVMVVVLVRGLTISLPENSM